MYGQEILLLNIDQSNMELNENQLDQKLLLCTRFLKEKCKTDWFVPFEISSHSLTQDFKFSFNVSGNSHQRN